LDSIYHHNVNSDTHPNIYNRNVFGLDEIFINAIIVVSKWKSVQNEIEVLDGGNDPIVSKQDVITNMITASNVIINIMCQEIRVRSTTIMAHINNL
jgi:hypothetical protein